MSVHHSRSPASTTEPTTNSMFTPHALTRLRSDRAIHSSLSMVIHPPRDLTIQGSCRSPTLLRRSRVGYQEQTVGSYQSISIVQHATPTKPVSNSAQHRQLVP